MPSVTTELKSDFYEDYDKCQTRLIKTQDELERVKAERQHLLEAIKHEDSAVQARLDKALSALRGTRDVDALIARCEAWITWGGDIDPPWDASDVICTKQNMIALRAAIAEIEGSA